MLLQLCEISIILLLLCLILWYVLYVYWWRDDLKWSGRILRGQNLFFFLRDSLSITESESKKSVNILVVEPLGTDHGGGKPYNSHTTTTTPSSNSIKCQFPTLFPWVCASESIKIIKNNTHTHRVCLQ